MVPGIVAPAALVAKTAARCGTEVAGRAVRATGSQIATHASLALSPGGTSASAAIPVAQNGSSIQRFVPQSFSIASTSPPLSKIQNSKKPSVPESLAQRGSSVLNALNSVKKESSTQHYEMIQKDGMLIIKIKPESGLDSSKPLDSDTVSLQAVLQLMAHKISHQQALEEQMGKMAEMLNSKVDKAKPISRRLRIFGVAVNILTGVFSIYFFTADMWREAGLNPKKKALELGLIGENNDVFNFLTVQRYLRTIFFKKGIDPLYRAELAMELLINTRNAIEQYYEDDKMQPLKKEIQGKLDDFSEILSKFGIKVKLQLPEGETVKISKAAEEMVETFELVIKEESKPIEKVEKTKPKPASKEDSSWGFGLWATGDPPKHEMATKPEVPEALSIHDTIPLADKIRFQNQQNGIYEDDETIEEKAAYLNAKNAKFRAAISPKPANKVSSSKHEMATKPEEQTIFNIQDTITIEERIEYQRLQDMISEHKKNSFKHGPATKPEGFNLWAALMGQLNLLPAK